MFSPFSNLYTGIVGARKYLYGGQALLWWVQMLLNFAWSPVFFRVKNTRAALAVIVLIWITIATFVSREWNADFVSACLFLPYLAWVSLATTLNLAIVLLN